MLRNQKGFTLIEIIAVLVILGVLAAVAIPKYMDLQKQAADKALEGGVAAGQSAVSMQYARVSLSKGGAANVTEVVTALGNANNRPSSTDFSYTFAAGTGANVDVTTSWINTGRAGNSSSKLRSVALQ